ncbi:MAG: proton-conducting transporter transmembrane domain-containing protein [Alphaproteobacteria bacterium]
MSTLPLLSLIIFLPLLGAIFLLFIKHERPQIAAKKTYHVSLWIALFNFILALLLAYKFQPNAIDIFQFTKKTALPTEEFYTAYQIGIDGLSLLFILLTSFIFPVLLCTVWQKKEAIKLKSISLLVLESLMLAAFSSLNIFLLCVFLESAILLTFFFATFAKRHFSFNALISLTVSAFLFLFAVMGIYQKTSTGYIPDLFSDSVIPLLSQQLICACLFISIALKCALFPFHRWFLDLTKKIPSSDFALLIHVLSLSAGYMTLRILLPLLPNALDALFLPLVIWVSVSLVYMVFSAYVQPTLKGFLTTCFSIGLAVFLLTALSVPHRLEVESTLLILLSHTLTLFALFLSLSQLEKIRGEITAKKIHAMGKKLPLLSMLLSFFLLAHVGVLGTASFVGKFLAAITAYDVFPALSILILLSSVILLAYSLRLIKALFFVVPEDFIEIEKAALKYPRILLLPFALITLWIGLAPNHILHISASSLDNISSIYTQSEEIENAVD